MNVRWLEKVFNLIFGSCSCFFLIDFDICLVNYQEILDRRSKVAAVWELDVILTSYNVISSMLQPERKNFWTYYLSSKFRCHSFNILVILVVKEGVESISPGPTTPKKARSE